MKNQITENQKLQKGIFKQGDLVNTKDMLLRMCKFYPNRPLLAELDNNKNVVQYDANQIFENTCALGDSLLNLNLAGKHIAIMAKNSIKYIFCELAVTNGVGIFVPIDKDAHAEHAQILLTKCKADALICDSIVLEKLKDVFSKCEKLKKIITIDKKIEGFDFVGDLIEQGKNLQEKNFLSLDVDCNKTCKILFTSGTTGANKGVELSQTNIVQNVHNFLDVVPYLKQNKTSLSVLPFHHSTEVNTHIYTRMADGKLIVICDSIKNFWRFLKKFHPDETIVVPMIANAIYKNIYTNNKNPRSFKRRFRLHKFLSFFGINTSRKIFKKEFEFLGGNFYNLIVGGAPLNATVAKGLNEVGITVCNGYGITECAPLVCMNTRIFDESVSMGTACPRLEVKLYNVENNVGELCVRGKNVSKGYFEDSESTSLVFDKDGYFHTGDLVETDKQGKIFLKGRKNNLIVLDNGKNVFPEEIEHKIESSMPYVKEVLVYDAEVLIGNQLQNVLCAGIFIEDESLRDRAKIESDFKALNSQISNYKRIAYVDILECEFEKTSSRKLKRTSAKNYHTTNKGVLI